MTKNRIRREKIYDDFSRNEYHELCDEFEVIEFPNKFYKIITKQGAIDFYPMSDKICMWKGKWWKSDWLKWIKTNLLKHL